MLRTQTSAGRERIANIDGEFRTIGVEDLRVLLRFEQIVPLAFGVQAVGVAVDNNLLGRMGLIPRLGDKVDESFVDYITLFSRLEVTGPRGTYEGWVPIDLKEPSILKEGGGRPIAVAPILETVGDVEEEMSKFSEGEHTKLAHPNMSVALSDPDHPCMIVESREGIDDPMRRLLITRTPKSEQLYNAIQPSRQEGILELDPLEEGGKIIVQRMDNGRWKGGVTFTGADPVRLHDPRHKVTIPLFINGQYFLLQIGFLKDPLLREGEGLLSTVRDLRAFAENTLDSAMRRSLGLSEILPLLSQREQAIYVHDLRNFLTSVYGYLGLYEKAYEAKEFDQAHSFVMKIVIPYVIDALGLVDQIGFHTEGRGDNLESVSMVDLITRVRDKDIEGILERRSPEDAKVHIILNIGRENQGLRAIGLPDAIRRLIVNAFRNSLKIARDRNINYFGFMIVINQALEADLKGVPQPIVSVTIADNLGGEPDEERIAMLNDPSTIDLSSKTGGAGSGLMALRDKFLVTGRFIGVQNPIFFSNTDTAGSKGFTIDLRLREISGD